MNKWRFKAANALHKHPNREDCSIKGAQGKSELESIKELPAEKLVDHLDQVTGIKALKRKYVLNN